MNHVTNNSRINFSSTKDWISLLLNYKFIIFLAFALLFQSLNSTASPAKYTNSSTSVSSNMPINSHENPFDLFIEEESSEEDEINHGVLHVNRVEKQYLFQELHFSCLINKRFLSLTSDIHKIADAPYFILYHTWKTDLV